MLKFLLYMLMVLGIPVLYCILLYRLRNRLPQGRIIVSILIGILIFRTVLSFPLYMLAPVISDSSYELFKTCLLTMIQFYMYGIVIMGLYIASYILMKKKAKFIIKVITITVIVNILICVLGVVMFKERERPDNLYLEMREINLNDSLIGLPKEVIITLLGEPISTYEYSNTNKESYSYDAGNIHVGIIWGRYNIFTTKHGYVFRVLFDENNKVESTSMEEII